MSGSCRVSVFARVERSAELVGHDQAAVRRLPDGGNRRVGREGIGRSLL